MRNLGDIFSKCEEGRGGERVSCVTCESQILSHVTTFIPPFSFVSARIALFPGCRLPSSLSVEVRKKLREMHLHNSYFLLTKKKFQTHLSLTDSCKILIFTPPISAARLGFPPLISLGQKWKRNKTRSFFPFSLFLLPGKRPCANVILYHGTWGERPRWSLYERTLMYVRSTVVGQSQNSTNSSAQKTISVLNIYGSLKQICSSFLTYPTNLIKTDF